MIDGRIWCNFFISRRQADSVSHLIWFVIHESCFSDIEWERDYWVAYTTWVVEWASQTTCQKGIGQYGYFLVWVESIWNTFCTTTSVTIAYDNSFKYDYKTHINIFLSFTRWRYVIYDNIVLFLNVFNYFPFY